MMTAKLTSKFYLIMFGGWVMRKRGKKVFHYIKKHTSSNAVIFLQETHSTKKDEMLWKLQWHGNIIFSHGSSNKKVFLLLLDTA